MLKNNYNLVSLDLFTVIDKVHDAVLLTDEAGCITFFNQAAEKLWGYLRWEVIGRKTAEVPLFPAENSQHEEMNNADALLTIVQRDGALLDIPATLHTTDEKNSRLMVLHVDQQKISQVTNYDNLTGLAKRVAMYRYVDELLSQAPSSPFALFFLDLDHFKGVNDALGYEAGDRALARIAGRLVDKFGQRAGIYHADSDSFILAVPQCQREEAATIAKDIQMLFRTPFDIDGIALNVTVSTGISLYPEQSKKRDLLLQFANHASHLAKQKGAGHCLFYSETMHQVDQDRLRVANALKVAIDNNQLALHYQPQVWLKKDELYGVEALVRWTDQQMGEISPGIFIPIAEETGDIEAIGRWTLNEACRQMAKWRNNNIDVPVVSVNLSPVNFYNSTLAPYISYLLTQYNLPPECLTIEITEGAMREKRPETMEVICAIRALGVGLSIDDFGTGYSCLARLAHLPMTELKIDQSFVKDLNNDKKMKAVAKTVVHMGQSLKHKVIAEGVETREQLQQLHILKCDIGQGFFYSRALNANALASWLEERSLSH
ncbi:EAL domain-containing protein [Pantoea sp. B65]|uniref:sensor domain-containing protein n=1 Tax=Pantoea sp. B65 TaxID=2813359 RepID=UPI0039B5C281